MKKNIKRIFESIFAFMIVLQNFCYADVISPFEHYREFHEDADSEKIPNFIKGMARDRKIIFVVLLCLFVVSGIMLLRSRNVNANNVENCDKSQKKTILNKVFFGSNVFINIFFIELLRSCMLYLYHYRPGSHLDELLIPKSIKIKFVKIYIIYAIFLLIIFLIKKGKKKSLRFFYIISLIINLGLIILCFHIIMITPSGYYTYDMDAMNSWFGF